MAKRLSATIEIEAPLLTKSSSPGEAGLDAVMAKNANNQAVLHDSHIKGRLLDAWRDLRPMLNIPLDDWLGTSGGKRSDLAGACSTNTGLIQFKDFVGPEIPELDGQPEAGERKGPRIRVQIDPERRAASEHMLQMIESPFPSGEHLTFHGGIECEDTVDIDLAKRAIKAGLYWASTFGGMRTSGFGRVLAVEIEETAAQQAALIPAVTNDQFWVWLTTTDSVCVTESRAMENLFVSGQVLPGSVIKGAVAATWLRSHGLGSVAGPGCDSTRPELSKYFDVIRFSHARIASVEGRLVRQVIAPLTIGKTGDCFRDFATADKVECDDVAFQPDWKDADFTEIARRFGGQNVATELRVRTAIESEKRRAKEAQLFARQLVVPKPDQGWMVCIDWSEVPPEARNLVKEQLASVISNGIRYVGKTKATMSVEFTATGPVAKVHSLDRSDLYVITLQTPVLLGNPEILTETHSKDDLFTAYATDFSKISDESLTLVRFFAKQRLEGGTYLYKRFMEGGPFPYQPYFVTCPGSVFVLKTTPGKDAEMAAAHIRDWSRRGLPPAPWCVNRYRRLGLDGNDLGGDHWSNNPYLRESGFAEIAVNLASHWEDPITIPPAEQVIKEGPTNE
jgi:hypothetical protein